MRILHILRSEPDNLVRNLIRKTSTGIDGKTVSLDAAEVDYDQLLMDIFAFDRVVSWW